MNVAVSYHGLAVTRGPALSPAVEIDRAREHGVALDGVEQMSVTVEVAPQACSRWKERMRRDDEPGRAPLERGKIIECPDGFCSLVEVQQQHVPAFDRALDAGNEHDATFRRIRVPSSQIQLMIVQRDRERVETECGSAIDQIGRRMRNIVSRIVDCVGVEFDFEHLSAEIAITVPLQQHCLHRPDNSVTIDAWLMNA